MSLRPAKQTAPWRPGIELEAWLSKILMVLVVLQYKPFHKYTENGVQYQRYILQLSEKKVWIYAKKSNQRSETNSEGHLLPVVEIQRKGLL